VNARSFTTIFGPVSSRRFGRSLGVDVIPRKLCTLDCVYCEVGRTDQRGSARKEYVATDRILGELREALPLYPDLNCVTYSGSGEPTLHARLGELIRSTVSLTTHPVVVLTNGTLLWREDVRQDLLAADVVCPSLNAVSEDIFRRINRPHPRLSAALVLGGLIEFRKVFRGQYDLEILFVHGLNDSEEEIGLLREACERIRPDRIHLNTVVRPPAEHWAKPVSYERLEEIRSFLGPAAEVLVRRDGLSAGPSGMAHDQDILSLLERRPMSLQEMEGCLSADVISLNDGLRRLLSEGKIYTVTYEGETYFAASREVHPI